MAICRAVRPWQSWREVGALWLRPDKRGDQLCVVRACCRLQGMEQVGTAASLRSWHAPFLRRNLTISVCSPVTAAVRGGVVLPSLPAHSRPHPGRRAPRQGPI